MKKIATTRILCYASALSALLAACSQVPKEAYYTRGQPESLLDVSSEVVDLHIDTPSSVMEVTNWINKDQPTRAELNCQQGSPLCSQVQNVLHQFAVPVKYTQASGPGTVALVYERVLARDCENRYIDNPINPYNLNHPTFGCTTAVNMVQMVSDKRQFTNPALTDYSDAIKGTQAAEDYKSPSGLTPQKAESSLSPMVTSGGGSGGGGGSSR